MEPKIKRGKVGTSGKNESKERTEFHRRGMKTKGILMSAAGEPARMGGIIEQDRPKRGRGMKGN